MPFHFLQKRTIPRTTPPAGALVVRPKNQTGEYGTINAAVAALGKDGSAKTIFIYPGTYNERVVLKYNGHLTIYGYTTDGQNWKGNQVIIQSSLNSTYAGSLDASAAISAQSANISMYNLNIYNTFGKGAQAVALSALGDRQGYYGCSIKGHQDTLMASKNRQYYSTCYIEGDTDFIFGDASAWFGKCTIGTYGASITANSRTFANETTWYVFDSSTITSATGATVAAGSAYLGRPWRVMSRVMYQNSNIGAVINAAGWTTMTAGATPEYREWNNTGTGSNTSKRQYETKSTGPVAISDVLGSDWKTWVDLSI